MKIQWSLLTILLLVTAIAAWAAYYKMVTMTPRLMAEAEAVSTVTGRLLVLDENQYAVLETKRNWWDDQGWRIHLPKGQMYRLHLATRNIKYGIVEFPDDNISANVTEGEHELKRVVEKQEDGAWKISILWDDAELLQQDETSDWKETDYSYSSPLGADGTDRHDVDKPLMIHRVIHHLSNKAGETVPPRSPANGMQIWVERIVP